MRDVRRAIHANPELSHEETATAALVRRELVAAGLREIEAVAGTGLLVTIRGRRSGRALALRADLDALPLVEASSVPFASRRPGVMHACGHDAHTAILLGVAIALHGQRERLRGSVTCVFQPAEESEPLGARQIVEAGHLKGIDAILALHVDPGLPVGQIGVRSGPFMAGADSLQITIRGRGGHGGLPHLGVDAIAVAAAVIQELQQIASRRIDPLEPVVLTIGRIEGGTAPNILADHVLLQGTVRALDERVRLRVRAMIRDVVGGVARAHGAAGTVEVLPGEPVLRNDEALTDLIRGAVRDVLGPAALHEMPRPELIAEDFAFYLEHVPGAMFRLGVGNPAKGIVHPLHHPGFALDEKALPIGAGVLLGAVWRFLEAGTVELPHSRPRRREGGR
ncbi:MAG: amidohydrolase [Candidatus Rokubacteria bacterium]|nr:amidohydrolase [Candidatus Rokubacteria bacterium]